MKENEVIFQRDKKYLSDVMKLRFYPINITGSKGSRVYDAEGKEYIDMSAGWAVMNLGYGHPKVIEALKAKLDNNIFTSCISYINPESIDLSERITQLLPGDFEKKVWFGHSGSDANEFLSKMLFMATGRKKIITFQGSYHGQTLGAYAMSGHPSLRTFPSGENNIKLPYPYCYRCPFGKEKDDCNLYCLDYIREEVLGKQCLPEEISAIVAESVQSDGGDIPAVAGFLKGLEGICHKHGIYLIFDEVKVGLGRTGKMFGFEAEDIVPDAVVIGKPIGGGLPLSLVAGRKELMDSGTGQHMFTTSGGPVVCAAALTTLQVIREEHLLSRAERMGALLMKLLTEVKKRCPYIGEIRGRGMIVGTELVVDQKTKAPARELAAMAVYRAYELGMLCFYTGLHSNVIEFTPPLILTEDEAKIAVNILEQAILDAASGKVSRDTLKAFSGWS
jgi:4-aminobutyrate aminotransferase